jgi:hypothetical protein
MKLGACHTAYELVDAATAMTGRYPLRIYSINVLDVVRGPVGDRGPFRHQVGWLRCPSLTLTLIAAFTSRHES